MHLTTHQIYLTMDILTLIICMIVTISGLSTVIRRKQGKPLRYSKTATVGFVTLLGIALIFFGMIVVSY